MSGCKFSTPIHIFIGANTAPISYPTLVHFHRRGRGWRYDEGLTHIGSLSLNTTGVFGASPKTESSARVFPVLVHHPELSGSCDGPSLALLLAWFFVINGLVYLLMA